MSTDLELVDTDDLVAEIERRFFATAILCDKEARSDAGPPGTVDCKCRFSGPPTYVLGLAFEAVLTAGMDFIRWKLAHATPPMYDEDEET